MQLDADAVGDVVGAVPGAAGVVPGVVVAPPVGVFSGAVVLLLAGGCSLLPGPLSAAAANAILT